MCDDDSGYDLTDPKHPGYHDRMSSLADQRRKTARENSCGHDGWVKGCPNCEANEAAASEAMGNG